ncbi:MAG TPA: lipase [Phycisphaerales bacterium]|nr:lipase [Phycisphaerales bacterium]
MAQNTDIADSNNYLIYLKNQMNLKWPNNRTINIVCHGHSVPAGYFKTPDVNTFDAYPHLLHKGIKDRFPYAVVNVIVTAIGGENSDAGEKRFEKDVLSHQPDVITIDYGLNDRSISLEKARAAWSSMIKKAKDKNIKVILLTPTPDIKHKPDDPNEPLNQHAQQIRQLAAEFRVGLADSLAVFDEKQKQGIKLDELLSQSNHPNEKGHRLVADELLIFFANDI